MHHLMGSCRLIRAPCHVKGLSAFGGGSQHCKIKQGRYPTTPLANRREILGPRLARLGSGAREALRLLGLRRADEGEVVGGMSKKATQPRPATTIRSIFERMPSTSDAGQNDDVAVNGE
jgi:hypothetical protein